MTWNIPNSLTMLRILAIPLIIVLFYLPIKHSGEYSGIIFALAGFTDWFDGYLARKLGQTSRFGAFLDPVADKLMVAVILILLVEHYGDLWITLSAMIINRPRDNGLCFTRMDGGSGGTWQGCCFLFRKS